MQADAVYLVTAPGGDAAAPEPSASLPVDLLVPIALASVCALLALGCGLRLASQHVQRRGPADARFHRAARVFGLGERERRLLRTLAAEANVEPSVLLVSEHLYRRACETYVESTSRSLPARETARIEANVFRRVATGAAGAIGVAG